MAEKEQMISTAGMLSAVADAALPACASTAPPTVSVMDQQDGPCSSPPQDLTAHPTTQPYPRSPRLARKANQGAPPSKEVLSKLLEELQAERSRTEAHLQSLKKRSAGLTTSAEAMKQEIRERFESMRQALQKDEQAVLDSVEQDRRETSGRLNRILRDWTQHLNQVQKNIASAKNALEQAGSAGAGDYTGDLSCHKKEEAAEEGIRMNEGRFQRLLKLLRNISKDLQAQLQRKTFLLDSSGVQIDRQTSHRHIAVAGDGRGMCYSSEPQSVQELPLQFDRVHCALGLVAVSKGKHYWEVDVRSCSAWAVGATYGCIERKGQEKGAKLGRNRNSWCVELRDRRLSAWHNDRHVACRISGHGPPEKVGVLVDYERDRLAFYDGRTMKLLQEFSAALTAVFDRMHHQFTEPIYPAFRFFKPQNKQLWPDRMEICDLHV